MLRDSVVV